MAMTEQQKEEFKALIADPLHGPVIQASIDARVTAALETYAQKNPSTADVSARLKAIVDGYEKKLSQAQLQNVVIRESFKRGLDPEIFENLGVVFADEKDVIPKLERFQSERNKLEIALRNKLISEKSFQPGSGESHREVNIDRLNEREMIALENGGRLDSMLTRNGRR